MLAEGSGAMAAPVTLTWSGLGGRWSEKASWEGGKAPGEVVEPVDLDFPLSACQPDPFGCGTLTDDVAGLVVRTITLDSRVVAFSSKGPGEPPQLDPGPVSYFVAGVEALTLTGGIDANTIEEGTGQGLAGSGGTTIDLPLVLGAANSWSVGPAPGALDIWGSVTGNHPLAVTLGEGDPLELAGNTDVGPIIITGRSGVTFGGPDADGDLNGTDGEPVELKGGSLTGGGRVGPLTLEAAGVEPGFPGSGGKLEVNGDLSLDSASNFTIEENPAGRTREATVSGHARLGSAKLTLFEACVQAGSTFTLLRAQGGVSGQFTGPGGVPVTNGQLLENLSPNGCGANDPAPALRIEYGPETVTATAVPVAAAPIAAQGGSGSAGGSSTGGSGGSGQGVASNKASSPELSVTGPVKVRSREILIPLRCASGEGACTSVGLHLSVMEHLLNGHLTGFSASSGSHRTTRTVVLASRRVTLAAGQNRTVEVPLDSAAARGLAQRPLHALLSVVYAGRTVKSEVIEIPPAPRLKR